MPSKEYITIIMHDDSTEDPIDDLLRDLISTCRIEDPVGAFDLEDPAFELEDPEENELRKQLVIYEEEQMKLRQELRIRHSICKLLSLQNRLNVVSEKIYKCKLELKYFQEGTLKKCPTMVLLEFIAVIVYFVSVNSIIPTLKKTTSDSEGFIIVLVIFFPIGLDFSYTNRIWCIMCGYNNSSLKVAYCILVVEILSKCIYYGIYFLEPEIRQYNRILISEGIRMLLPIILTIGVVRGYRRKVAELNNLGWYSITN